MIHLKQWCRGRHKANYVDDTDEEELRKAYMEDKAKGSAALVVVQEYVFATAVSLENYKEPISFPWHGFSQLDFERLNERLIKAIPLFKTCETEKDLRRTKRKFSDVYNAFYARTIMCWKKDDRLVLGCDGRHRTLVAQKYGNEIPVIIVEEVKMDDIDFETYKARDLYYSWKFI